ncbi:MAG: ABC transporter ATP-binding protein [Christensenellales bacterium]|jgi:teichoic acid transport system ATP-binding protein
MTETAIQVKDLYISYRNLNRVSIKKLRRSSNPKDMRVFGAINGISLEVKRGEIVGLIGRNGSGKTTLLRAMAGIFAPNSGTINTYGNTISLLSIGVGFQSKLSGRENIFLSGLLLGYSEAMIREKLDEIIEFSELGDFIDMPVQTYSSGMYSKLAFSITAIMEPDIMLVDEVLSVGDAKFKKKSYNKMMELIADHSRTVIIVSHSADVLRKLCNRAIWINKGKIVKQGDVKEVMEAYENH